jgi:ribonuclease G
MSTEILINTNSLETRVALLENGIVTELYIERSRDRGIVGNVYKGRIIKVLPGMQAAFVDIGLEKAGFLYVSDVDFAYNLEEYEEIIKVKTAAEEGKANGQPDISEHTETRSFNYPVLIEDMLQKGQEILVQVSKESMGSKGPRLTSYITLPGRYLVFMPTIDQIGVSRRIENETERKRLRDLIRTLKPPGVGYIVRTASEGQDIDELSQDIKFLNKLWQDIQAKNERTSAPYLIHRDLNLIFRTIRDLFTNEVERLIIDSPYEYQNCIEFVRSYLPHLEPKIELYSGREPLFDAYGIELEISRALGRKVWLKSGGYITIEQTEALCAIDVNTGRFVGEHNPEETILKTNLEAIKEIIYQIRLRNIGGIIIIDFIDMVKEESREKVFQVLQTALKRDKAKTNILKMSELGVVEMTRQRIRDSLDHILCQPCPYCEGRGMIKSTITVCHEVFREIQRADKGIPSERRIIAVVHPEVADILLGEESSYLDQLEKDLKKKIIVKVNAELHREQFEIIA